MTDFLPLFPLKLVVFPGEHLNLHIFEPRYKQLIRECEQNEITFGIPAFIENKIMTFGTEIRLKEISKRYPNGEMDIKTQGIGIFKIHELYSQAPQKLYSGADITRLNDTSEGDAKLNEDIFKQVKVLFELLKVAKKAPINSTDFITYELAHHVGFSLEQEYQFLCIETEKKRQDFMLKHITKMIPIVEQMERLRQRANMNGHFKNVIPPEI